MHIEARGDEGWKNTVYPDSESQGILIFSRDAEGKVIHTSVSNEAYLHEILVKASKYIK